MYTDNIFGERLRELMQTANPKVTQQKLADAIGVKRQSIAQYLTGNIQPPLSTVAAISDYFDISIDYLTGRTDIKSRNIEIKEICKITGLSEKALDTLKTDEYGRYLINIMLESDLYKDFIFQVKQFRCLTASKEFGNEFRGYWINVCDQLEQDIQDIFGCREGQHLVEAEKEMLNKYKELGSIKRQLHQLATEMVENEYKEKQEAGADAEKEAGGE